MILDVLFPEKCLYCKKYGKIICDSCYEKLNNKSLFKEVYGNYFDCVFCGSFYNDIVKKQIHNFKFHNQAYFYKYFIEISLKNTKVYNFLKNFDLITFIPMNNLKQLKRGYNQSELLAKELGKRLNIEVVKTLEKQKNIKIQSTLNEYERVKNAQNAFKIIDNINLENKNIILVDDILTTGATVKSASKILKQNKCNKILVFTIAKTQIKQSVIKSCR